MVTHLFLPTPCPVVRTGSNTSLKSMWRGRKPPGGCHLFRRSSKVLISNAIHNFSRLYEQTKLSAAGPHSASPCIGLLHYIGETA
jgi:hypothetical protein